MKFMFIVSRIGLSSIFFCTLIASCTKPKTKTQETPDYQLLNKDTLSGDLVRVDFAWFSNAVYLVLKDKDNDSLYSIQVWYRTKEYSQTRITTSDWLDDSTTHEYPPADKDKDSVYVVMHKAKPCTITIDIQSNTELKHSLGVRRINAHLTSETPIWFAYDNSYDRSEYIKEDSLRRHQAETFIERKIAHSIGPDTMALKDYSSTTTYIKVYWNQ